MRRRTSRNWRVLSFEELESRLVPTGSSYTVPLDPNLDQFGDQIATIQAYEDTSRLAFSIFDTGASAVTFSPDDQENNFTTPIPLKVIGGAIAGGVGGTVTGDVSQPGTILADGMHAMSMSFDQYGFPYYNISTGPSTAMTPGIQAFVGTSTGSPDLPTITGTPILSKSSTNPNGLAALIDMQGVQLDFSGLVPGLVMTMPDIHFVAPGVTPTVTAGTTTTPFYVSLDTFGTSNYSNPGDLITEAPSPLDSHVGMVKGGTTITDQHFLLDTGAQLTVISPTEANRLGFDLAHPDTTITVGGVGGSVDVPGFTLPELDLPTADGGTLQFTHVPVYVLDVAPGIDGLLGMNLFNTAASMTYDPYYSHDLNNAVGGSLGLTFNTDPNRGAGQLSSSDAALLQGLGVSFVGTMSGHALPDFHPPGASATPVVSSPGNLSGAEGAHVSLQIGATNAQTFHATGLPAGLTINNSGVVSGTIGARAEGTYTVTITAFDGTIASSPVSFNWTVTDSAPPLLASPGNQTSDPGAPVQLSISATDADTFNATGLPTGLSISNSGVITGTVNAPVGTYHVSVTASDGSIVSAATAFTWTVNKASTTSTLKSSANPAFAGQTITFTATISSAAPGTQVATGSVTFKDGATVLGTGTLTNGVATFKTLGLTVATHAITAIYGGDSNFKASTSVALSQVVNGIPPLTLKSSANPAVYGQTITFTASFTTGQQSGIVTFRDGTIVLGVATLTRGLATFKTAALSVGTHSIIVTYEVGRSIFPPITSLPVSQIVNKAPTKVALAGSLNPAAFGQSVTFTATITPTAPGAGTPTGTVTFKDGTTVIGTATIGAGGVAKLTLSGLTRRTHALTAFYSGDINFLSSLSGILNETVH